MTTTIQFDLTSDGIRATECRLQSCGFLGLGMPEAIPTRSWTIPVSIDSTFTINERRDRDGYVVERKLVVVTAGRQYEAAVGAVDQALRKVIASAIFELLRHDLEWVATSVVTTLRRLDPSTRVEQVWARSRLLDAAQWELAFVMTRCEVDDFRQAWEAYQPVGAVRGIRVQRIFGLQHFPARDLERWRLEGCAFAVVR